MKLRTIPYFFTLFSFLSVAAIASDISPAGSKEEESIGIKSPSSTPVLPVPTGNLSYAALPDCLCPPSAQGDGHTWFYVGLPEDAATKQRCSFETFLGDITGSGSNGVGFFGVYFAFQDETNQQFYAQNTYGGEDRVLQALKQGLCRIQSEPTSSETFSIAGYTLESPLEPSFTIKKVSSSSQQPLYQGKVGQPGAGYALESKGSTFLWKFGAGGQIEIMPYTYSFSFLLLDTRGFTPEGFGGSYVGPALVSSTNSQNASTPMECYQMAQPLLAIQNWSMVLTSSEKPLDGFKTEYKFGGTQGTLWADFQRYTYGSTPNIRSKVLAGLPQFIAEKNPSLAKSLGMVAAEAPKDKSWSLYNGNWIAIMLQESIYEGCSLSTSVFWNKNIPNPPSQNSDDSNWCYTGFSALYTGNLANDVASTYVTPETLKVGNPGSNIDLKGTNFFQVKVNQYADQKKYGLTFPWITSLDLTIRPHTQIRYALAAYAHRKNPKVFDDVSKPVTLTVQVPYSFTQNTVFSKNLTQYFESGAVVLMNGKSVGTGWIEHMVDLGSAPTAESNTSLASTSKSSWPWPLSRLFG
ncbi:hypothetical protein [Candidatus Finniella inopinata]|uniref:AttH domain-containing protein n=1 Tax=Candidatus Finniella inopinata TaxID=1696036 RepID=A0A4V2DZP1_9PROT|nr:hypothetical protein [Candidatus Finniella inopinata]RZI45737.1 hypothetical protein EQU50_06450 [Candidatus Finniella inopinata]